MSLCSTRSDRSLTTSLRRVPADRVDVVVLDVGDEAPVGSNPLDVTDQDRDVVDGILAVFGQDFTDGWSARTLAIFSGALVDISADPDGPGFRRAGCAASPPTTDWRATGPGTSTK